MRNERRNIRSCLSDLSRFCKGGVICDNGSVDGSIGLARKVSKELSLDTEVISHPWYDYGKNRTMAMMELRKFLRTRYHTDEPLTVDEIHEMTKVNIFAFITDFDNKTCMIPRKSDNIYESLKSTVSPSVDGFYIQSVRGDVIYATINCVRIDLMEINNWNYSFSLHECIVPSRRDRLMNLVMVNDIYIDYGRTGERSRNPNNGYRDLELLDNDAEIYKNEPLKLSRILFYKGQTYLEMGMYDIAEKTFVSAYTLENGSFSEQYVSSLRAAACCLLSESGDYEMRYRNHIMTAYNSNAPRLEAPYYMAKIYYDEKKWKLCWNVGTPYLRINVKRDELFIEMDVTSYKFYELMAICGFRVGKIKDGLDLMKRAIDNCHDIVIKKGLVEKLNILQKEAKENGWKQ